MKSLLLAFDLPSDNLLFSLSFLNQKRVQILEAYTSNFMKLLTIYPFNSMLLPGKAKP